MKEATKTTLIVLACVLVLAILMYAAVILLKQSDNEEQTQLPDNIVTKIIDGDTFQLASGDTVRLICVDTPEIGKEGSEEATQFLSGLILNKELKLENDTDDKDAYGRLLRYAYIDDLFINKEIVSQGHGTIFRYGNNTKLCDEIENQ